MSGQKKYGQLSMKAILSHLRVIEINELVRVTKRRPGRYRLTVEVEIEIPLSLHVKEKL